MQSIDLIRDNLTRSRDRVLARVEEMRAHSVVFPTPNGGARTLWVLGHLAYIDTALGNEKRCIASVDTDVTGEVVLMILTILEAQVALGEETKLQAAYDTAGAGAVPRGLVRSELLRDTRDPTRWRIQTWWASRQALDEMRQATATPAGILMFRAAGAEPSIDVFEVMDSVVPAS
jgi:heme-degrading monooxygenase HmoA